MQCCKGWQQIVIVLAQREYAPWLILYCSRGFLHLAPDACLTGISTIADHHHLIGIIVCLRLQRHHIYIVHWQQRSRSIHATGFPCTSAIYGGDHESIGIISIQACTTCSNETGYVRIAAYHAYNTSCNGLQFSAIKNIYLTVQHGNIAIGISSKNHVRLPESSK